MDVERLESLCIDVSLIVYGMAARRAKAMPRRDEKGSDVTEET